MTASPSHLLSCDLQADKMGMGEFSETDADRVESRENGLMERGRAGMLKPPRALKGEGSLISMQTTEPVLKSRLFDLTPACHGLQPLLEGCFVVRKTDLTSNLHL